MPSGATCGSLAVSGTTLCYHHSVVKTALGKSATASHIPFIFPEDRAALQINYFLLLQAYTEGRIDLRCFNSMQRLLRSMASNLGKKPLAEEHANTTDTPATTDPSEKEIKKPAATVSAPRPVSSRESSGGDNRDSRQFKPAPQTGAQPKPRALPSFEEIAAQHKPLRAECFLIAPDKLSRLVGV
jgi:hypothetical protein